MTSRAGSIVKNRKQLGRRISLDTSMLGITSFAIDIDSDMGTPSFRLHINWSLEQFVSRVASLPTMSGGFSSIFQRLAVFKSPRDKMRPRFARIAATHFKMNDLPPLIARRTDGIGHTSLTQKRNSKIPRRKHANSPSSLSLAAQRSHPHRQL